MVWMCKLQMWLMNVFLTAAFIQCFCCCYCWKCFDQFESVTEQIPVSSLIGFERFLLECASKEDNFTTTSFLTSTHRMQWKKAEEVNPFNLFDIHTYLLNTTFVVYFDQRTHACACVRMVENDQNHSKMSKRVLFSSCVREAYERLTRGLRTKTRKKVCWSAIGSDS